jgi:hypothetical protein
MVMAHYLYRKSSGQILGMSEGEPFTSDIYYGNLTDPITSGNPGPNRIFDGTKIRNATSVEISSFVGDEQADDKKMRKDSEKQAIDTQYAIRAIASVITSEVNLLRSSLVLDPRTEDQIRHKMKLYIDTDD